MYNNNFFREIITFVEERNAPWWYGYALVIFLFIVSQTRSIFLNNYYYSMYRCGFKIQAALMTAIYDKVLNFFIIY